MHGITMYSTGTPFSSACLCVGLPVHNLPLIIQAPYVYKIALVAIIAFAISDNARHERHRCSLTAKYYIPVTIKGNKTKKSMHEV